MSDKKQTAVQYLIEEIKNDSLLQAKSTEEWNEVFQKAKEMEREHIVHAFLEGTKMIDINNELSARFNACVYYIETYGGQDEN
jgi:hypothetical protein